MCMLHERWPGSLRAVKSLKGQVDVLYLCLNKFARVPPELKQDWIRILHRSKSADGDTAHLRLLRKLEPAGAHVLLCDDDLTYPKSYARDFLAAHKKHPNAILTHHGHIAEYPDEGDFTYTEGLDFREPQHGFKRLTVPGTGVSFIPGAVFDRLRFNDLPYLKRVDIHLACNGLKHDIPVIGIPHERGYFYMLGGPGPNHWIEMSPESDWMDRVYKTYRSYDLSLTRPPKPKDDPPPPAAGGERVVALMGMRYHRWPGSLQAVESLAGQVDTLYLHLDGFPGTPPELERNWIQILHRGKDEPDDTAQWYLLRRPETKNAHVLLCDDNLRYPDTYVEYFLRVHAEHPDALLTHHGHIEDRSGADGFTYAEALSFREPSRQIQYPNVPGTGVSFIPKSLAAQLELRNPPALKRVDIHLACHCAKLGVPVIGMQHRPTFIKMIDASDLSNWIKLPTDSSWMDRVYKTYRSYDLSLTRPPKPKDDPPPPAAGGERVVALMGMRYHRWPGSLQAVESLAGQVDTLYLHLDGFPGTPPELERNWIQILHRGKDEPDDTAQWYLLRRPETKNAHVLLCDDNLRYPDTYVEYFLRVHAEHPDALLTHHGHIEDRSGADGFTYAEALSFREPSRQIQYPNVPGTGVSFIPKSLAAQLELRNPPALKRVDIHLACHCAKLGVPVIGMQHRPTFIKMINTSDLSNWIKLPSDSRWMNQVYKTYQFYGLDVPSPREDVPSPRNNVVATMCMQHRRWPGSLKTVESLKGQVDTLYLCLNDFWEVPPELKQDWIRILHLGRNLGDAARFYLLRNLGPLDAHVVSCDDDIQYPNSHVQDFLTAHARHPDAVLTHHGRIAQYEGGQNFRYQFAMSFHGEARELKRITLPGSGVTFIPKSIFNRMRFTSLTHFNQADVHLACNCLSLGVPIMGLPHEKNYFRYIGGAGSIYASVTSRSDWMNKVYDIYRSYGLSLTQPPEPEA